MVKNKMPAPLEGEEQAMLFSWAQMFAYRYPELKLMFHIPNGGKRSKVEAARFKKEGVKSGVPDIFLPVARGKYHGLFIELKRLEKGRVSSAQSDWIPALREQRYAAEVCKGWVAASALIEKYLKGEYKNGEN